MTLSSYQQQRIMAIMAVLFVTLLATPLWAGTSTPWEFFRQNAAYADSVSKRLGLIFFTIVLMWLQLGSLRLLLPIALIGLAASAIRNPHVRGSRLVQIGFSIFLLGFVPLLLAGVLMTDNPIGFGMLFAFLSPIGLLVIVVGTTLALLKT
jgi:hypothetical protein